MRLSVLFVSAFLCLGAPLLHAETADDAKPAATAPKAAAKSAPAVGRVNVNTADTATLGLLKGVGEKKAQAIVAYRKAHGPFNSLAQFEAVPGIGPSIIAKNKSSIAF